MRICWSQSSTSRHSAHLYLQIFSCATTVQLLITQLSLQLQWCSCVLIGCGKIKKNSNFSPTLRWHPMVSNILANVGQPYAFLDVGNYHCSICELDFPFKSKLDRHLKSSDHIFFTQCIQRQGLAYGGIEDEEVRIMNVHGHDHDQYLAKLIGGGGASPAPLPSKYGPGGVTVEWAPVAITWP
ncbi:hypothetical protein SPONL_1897 [uncultured Candidatus Thioglobus sp.]|nr:hypothetical protein SPONL_1897 [uncultured Candidatus Thioglobus sp.]